MLSISTSFVYLHPDPVTTLVPALSAHLPYAIPLLRRLQHHTATSSLAAKAFATFAPGSAPPRSGNGRPERNEKREDDDDDDLWAAVFVDRSRRPETEGWVWTSLEGTAKEEDEDGSALSGTTERGGHYDAARRAKRSMLARSQLIALLEAAIFASDSAMTPFPGNTTEPYNSASGSGSGEDQYRSASGAPPSPIMILGSLNESLLPLLAGGGLSTLPEQKVLSRDPPRPPTGRPPDCPPTVLCGTSVPYAKWLVPFPSFPPPASPLPAHYTFSAPLPQDIPLIVSRSEIPRTVATLAQLGSQGVRHSPPGADPAAGGTSTTLVAWAFVSVDGSLSTLHTESGHRGQGIAKAVARSLFATMAKDPTSVGFAPLPASAVPSSTSPAAAATETALAHVDIAIDNTASAGVLRSLGAKVAWRVRWVGVDRDALRREVGRLQAGS